MLESAAAEERLAEFRAHAEAVLANHPELRSVMAVVAQYYDDHAQDAVHLHLVASPRDVPVWPHECSDDLGDHGERCGGCLDELGLWKGDSWYWNAFESYCHEHAYNTSSHGEEFLPIAIVRRDEFVWVGRMQRPQNELLPARAEPDARELALRAQLREAPDDEATRAVLEDLRLERDHGPRDTLGALSAAIPAGCATFERGELVGADVYAVDDATRDHPGWSTVRTLRYLPGSADVTCAAMTSLRELGPIGPDGARALARGRWNLERLHVAGAEALEQLATARLPHLRELIVEDVLDLELLQPWGGRVGRLVLARRVPSLISREDPAMQPSFASWPMPPRELRAALGVPVLAACDVIDECAGVGGIEVAFSSGGAELRVVGWHPHTSLDDLARTANAWPGELTYVSSPYRVFDDLDETRIALRR